MKKARTPGKVKIMEPLHTELSAEDSFDHIYTLYQPRIFAYLLSKVSHRELAEDLCQETFIKVLRRWDQRHLTHKLLPWIYCIAKHTLYDEFRRPVHRRSVLLAEDVDLPDPSSYADQIELGVTVRAALSNLPNHERVPLLLQTLGGCQLKEIARHVGCSEPALKSRLIRSRARFKKLYAAEPVDEPRASIAA